MEKLKPSDLTAYARIRNAALKLFAERGASASSVRAVAKIAGVSPGLVQHHFKTKAELQAALESYVAETVMALAAVSLTDDAQPGRLTLGRKIVEFIRENPDIIRYMRRVILEDEALGHRLFDQIVAAGRILMERLKAQGFLRDDIDMEWATLNTVLMVVGPALLESGFTRYLNHPFRSEEGLARWDASVDEMLTRGIYRPMPEQQSRTKPENASRTPTREKRKPKA